MSQPFEFVLLDSPGLARRPDPEAFEEHFAGAEAGVAAFANLGGDAIMVVPAPLAEPSAYGHLAAFVRLAPEAQRHALWQSVGEAMARRVGPKPVWLSTAGAGVSWLHVRLDDRPKYYGFGPYKQIRAEPSRINRRRGMTVLRRSVGSAAPPLLSLVVSRIGKGDFDASDHFHYGCATRGCWCARLRLTAMTNCRRRSSKRPSYVSTGKPTRAAVAAPRWPASRAAWQVGTATLTCGEKGKVSEITWTYRGQKGWERRLPSRPKVSVRHRHNDDHGDGWA